MSGRRRILVNSGELSLCQSDLESALRGRDPRAAGSTREVIVPGRGVQLFELVENLSTHRISNLLLLLLQAGVILAVICGPQVQLRDCYECSVVSVSSWLLLVFFEEHSLHSARVKSCSLRFEEAKGLCQIIGEDLPPIWINYVLIW